MLVSAKRKGSAIVEFESSGVSSDILEETGHKDNPLSLIWLSGKPTNSKNSSYSSGLMNSVPHSNGCEGHKDFESLVLMRMRQAEERKKLIEQMMKEDGE
ncbi:hypothetical protein EGW08_007855, partial [Elysia chlorotica]